MRYNVAKTEIIDPDIHSPEWEKAEIGYVACDRWNYSPVPETEFRMLRGPEGISVRMNTKERHLRMEQTEENSRVCDDSCMEFFFKPDPWDFNYINFEFNPRGVMFLSIGKDRHDRLLLDTDRAIFSIASEPKEGDWTLKFYIPDPFLLTHFEKLAPVCRGNFYKCAQASEHSHFGTWNEVEVDHPDFHLSDFFGLLSF